nr:hypothetical protein [uncultured bacterium]
MLWLAAQVFLLCLASFLAGAGITALATRRRSEVPQIQEPGEDQEEPMVVKASRKSMRYHTPDSPDYDQVSSTLTFVSPQEAELAGYRAWDKVTEPTP